VHKDITHAMRTMRSCRRMKDAKQLLLQLQYSSEADIYLHMAFMRALPLWLDRHWTPSSKYPLYMAVEPILQRQEWPRYSALLLWCSKEQEEARQAKRLERPMRQMMRQMMPLMPPLPQTASQGAGSKGTTDCSLQLVPAAGSPSPATVHSTWPASHSTHQATLPPAAAPAAQRPQYNSQAGEHFSSPAGAPGSGSPASLPCSGPT
jgi:hypothetical protein